MKMLHEKINFLIQRIEYANEIYFDERQNITIIILKKVGNKRTIRDINCAFRVCFSSIYAINAINLKENKKSCSKGFALNAKRFNIPWK